MNLARARGSSSPPAGPPPSRDHAASSPSRGGLRRHSPPPSIRHVAPACRTLDDLSPCAERPDSEDAETSAEFSSPATSAPLSSWHSSPGPASSTPCERGGSPSVSGASQTDVPKLWLDTELLPRQGCHGAAGDPAHDGAASRSGAPLLGPAEAELVDNGGATSSQVSISVSVSSDGGVIRERLRHSTVQDDTRPHGYGRACSEQPAPTASRRRGSATHRGRLGSPTFRAPLVSARPLNSPPPPPASSLPAPGAPEAAPVRRAQLPRWMLHAPAHLPGGCRPGSRSASGNPAAGSRPLSQGRTVCRGRAPDGSHLHP